MKKNQNKLKPLVAFFLIVQLFSLGIAHSFNFETGVYSGNATDNRSISIVGSWTPSIVMVKCNAAVLPVISLSSMGADLTDTWGTTAVPTANRIQAMSAGAFEIGSSTTVNTSGTNNCYYAAWGTDSNNDLSVGTYVGDGNDNRNITTSPAFQPESVLIFHNYDDVTVFRTSAFASGVSAPIAYSSASTTNVIQAFNADGFQVGTNNSVNAPGGTYNYYYMTLKAVAGYTAAGSYTATGSPTDGLEINIGFQPDFVMIKKDNASNNGVFRFSSMSGDFSCDGYNASTCTTDQIQSFTANGFTIGLSGTVQTASEKYWYYAIKSPVYSSQSKRRTIIIQ